MAHECIVRTEPDLFAYSTQYLVSCRCHMGSTYKIWRPGDEPVLCPVSATVLTESIDGEKVGGQ